MNQRDSLSLTRVNFQQQSLNKDIAKTKLNA